VLDRAAGDNESLSEDDAAHQSGKEVANTTIESLLSQFAFYTKTGVINMTTEFPTAIISQSNQQPFAKLTIIPTPSNAPNGVRPFKKIPRHAAMRPLEESEKIYDTKELEMYQMQVGL